jgi:hypothetical protein
MPPRDETPKHLFDPFPCHSCTLLPCNKRHPHYCPTTTAPPPKAPSNPPLPIPSLSSSLPSPSSPSLSPSLSSSSSSSSTNFLKTPLSKRSNTNLQAINLYLCPLNTSNTCLKTTGLRNPATFFCLRRFRSAAALLERTVLPSFTTALRISWVAGEGAGRGAGGLVMRDGEVWGWRWR